MPFCKRKSIIEVKWSIYIFKHLSPGLCDNTPAYSPFFNLKSKAQTLINTMFNIPKKVEKETI